MDLRIWDRNTGEKLVVLLVALMIPALALAQNKKSSAPAPAPKAAAPAAHPPQGGAKPATPSNAQRGPTTARPGGTSTAGRPATGATPNRGATTAGGANTRGTTNTRGAATAGGANRGTGAAAGTRPGTANTRGGGTAGAANAKGGPGNAGRPNTAGGPKTAAGPKGTTTRQVNTRSGPVNASYRGGNVRSIQGHNMRIDHGVHGGRRVVTERNGRRVVGMGHGRGYSERAYYRGRGGRAYYQRTYYMGGRRYAYAYRGYYYHGYRYYGYAPAYYYHPVYYGWAYNPWPAPVYYNWGWAGVPWYGAYGYYYAPYPVYPAAYFWLTDYMIAANLQAAYDAGVAAGQAGAAGGMASLVPDTNLFASLVSSDPLIAANLEVPYVGALSVQSATQTQLSKEVKDGLADEVKAQIAADKAAAEKPQASISGLATPAVVLLPLMFAPASEPDEMPPALDPKFRYFVVATDEDLSPDSGQDCSLTQGDVLKRTGDQLDSNNAVEVTVMSSKKNDCAVGTKAMLDSNELQEMYNHFRETLDAGMKSLAENAGKNGVPAAPDTSTTAGEVPAPTPDANVDSDLQQQQKDADALEAEVKQNSGGQ